MSNLNIESLLASAEKQNKAEDKRNEKKQFKLLRSFPSFVLYYNENYDIKVNRLKKAEEEKAAECENEADALTLTVMRGECDDEELVNKQIAKLEWRADYYRKTEVYSGYVFKCKDEKTFLKVLRIALRFKDKSVNGLVYQCGIPAKINGKERCKKVDESIIPSCEARVKPIEWNFDLDKDEMYIDALDTEFQQLLD
jgi:hypothetical protein